MLAFGGVGVLISLAERYSPRAGRSDVDGVVLGFTLGLALVVAVLLSYTTGLAKDNALGAWLAGMGRSSASRRRQRLQRGLVVAQIAVSVVLLTGAGLLGPHDAPAGRGGHRIRRRRRGADAGGAGASRKPRTPPSRWRLYQRMRERVAALPGVTTVGLGSSMPLRNPVVQFEVKAEGRPLAPGEPMPRADYRTASPEYFRAAGIPLVAGREFDASDRMGGPMVVILNKTLADRLFPGIDPARAQDRVDRRRSAVHRGERRVAHRRRRSGGH